MNRKINILVFLVSTIVYSFPLSGMDEKKNNENKKLDSDINTFDDYCRESNKKFSKRREEEQDKDLHKRLNNIKNFMKKSNMDYPFLDENLQNLPFIRARKAINHAKKRPPTINTTCTETHTNSLDEFNFPLVPHCDPVAPIQDNNRQNSYNPFITTTFIFLKKFFTPNNDGNADIDRQLNQIMPKSLNKSGRPSFFKNQLHRDSIYDEVIKHLLINGLTQEQNLQIKRSRFFTVSNLGNMAIDFVDNFAHAAAVDAGRTTGQILATTGAKAVMVWYQNNFPSLDEQFERVLQQQHLLVKSKDDLAGKGKLDQDYAIRMKIKQDEYEEEEKIIVAKMHKLDQIPQEKIDQYKKQLSEQQQAAQSIDSIGNQTSYDDILNSSMLDLFTDNGDNTDQQSTYQENNDNKPNDYGNYFDIQDQDSATGNNQTLSEETHDILPDSFNVDVQDTDNQSTEKVLFLSEKQDQQDQKDIVNVESKKYAEDSTSTAKQQPANSSNISSQQLADYIQQSRVIYLLWLLDQEKQKQYLSMLSQTTI